jgi:hypothetical protein
MEGNALGIPVDCRFRRDCHPCHDGPLAPEHFAASPRGHRHSSKLLDSPGWLPQECLEESGAAVLERGQTFSEFLTTRVKSESPRTEVQRLAFRPHLAVAQATGQTQVKKPLCGGNRSQLSCGLWMVRCAHRPETGSPPAHLASSEAEILGISVLPAYHAGGRRFEPRRSRQSFSTFLAFPIIWRDVTRYGPATPCASNRNYMPPNTQIEL